jgi:hypothetical protein
MERREKRDIHTLDALKHRREQHSHILLCEDLLLLHWYHKHLGHDHQIFYVVLLGLDNLCDDVRSLCRFCWGGVVARGGGGWNEAGGCRTGTKKKRKRVR